MGITQIFIIVLAVALVATASVAIAKSREIREVAAVEMTLGILPKQMRELIKTAEKNRTVDAPARFLGDSLQQYFAVAGVLNRRKAIDNLRRLVSKMEGTSSVVSLDIRVSENPLSVYPGFDLMLQMKNAISTKKINFGARKNEIGTKRYTYRD
ncbi:MAG TPA: hypothetical protein PLX95_00990 [bacterium]|jgi:hypothetical protein|nr:hypothetical protein [bacterium]